MPKGIGRILVWWSYFRRGHSVYLAFLVSLANFLVIQYRLLIEQIETLRYFFDSFILFAFTFLLVYIPLATIVGWYDYRKASYPVDATIMVRNNPWTRDFIKALIAIAEGRPDDAKKVLQKWIEEGE